MPYIDVHCHLDMCKDIPGIIKRAREKEVKIIVTNGTEPETNRKALEFSGKYEEVRAALGMYPIDALKMDDEQIKKELDFIEKNKSKIVAIGEVGMDFKESDEKQRQKEIFSELVKLGIKINKPVIVHSRKAEQECIDVLEELGAKKVIMHCFSGKISLVKRIIENGWSLSIPASVKNSEHFQNVVKITPMEQLLCETDAPFLHPDKLRDNEPMFVIESYKKIAEIKKIKLDNVRKKIEDNYMNLF